MKLTRIRLDEIMSDNKLKKWDGDNVYQGLQILANYVNIVVNATQHDIIYGPSVEIMIDAGLTEEDAIKLRNLNWMIDEDAFACFV